MSMNAERNTASAERDLQPCRQQLDRINLSLVDLLAQRMDVCRTIAGIKHVSGIPMMQPHRITSTLDQVMALSRSRQLRPEYLERVFELIIKETCDEELRIMDALDQSRVEE
ncbi:chorismate mutase [Pseudomonas gingeri]|nr:chorismate mutase [Pseudomonas gingeri]NVZ77444.1 chorismate mutase [Pseudomonas gingeri]NWD08904.1 chorismate mutase [Pseudomonas gingeri]NWD48606.1 chorismate mutase [Pseudomonas gingeri]NWE36218.1 chorismate mutase [Pseudomonas gingeri]